MHPKTKEIMDKIITRLSDFPQEKEFTLQIIMKNIPVWEENYSKHAAAGRVFYNFLEKNRFKLPNRLIIESLSGPDEKPQWYKIVGGEIGTAGSGPGTLESTEKES